MNESFGAYIKNLRGNRTKKELAEASGFTAEYIRRIEEENKIPSQKILVKLATGLNISPRDLIFRALKEKGTPETKEFFKLTNIDYFYTVKSLLEIVAIDDLNLKEKHINDHLLDSLVFKISGDFLKPLILDKQKAIVSFSASIKPSDYLICEITAHEQNSKKIISFLGPRDNIKMHKGPACIAGRLISRKEGVLKIRHLEENKIIEIDESDVEIKTKIIGVLF